MVPVSQSTPEIILYSFSKEKEEMKPQDSPKVESEPSKNPSDAEATNEVEEPSAGSGWGGWTGGWIDSNSASSLLGKAMSSVTAAVEVAKSKV